MSTKVREHLGDDLRDINGARDMQQIKADPNTYHLSNMEHWRGVHHAVQQEYNNDPTHPESPAGQEIKRLHKEICTEIETALDWLNPGNSMEKRIRFVCDDLYDNVFTNQYAGDKIDKQKQGGENESSNDYAIHKKNNKWIVETFTSEEEIQPSQNKTVIRVKELYKKEFGLKIGKTTILRYVDRAE